MVYGDITVHVFISILLGLFFVTAVNADADNFVLKSPKFSNNTKIPVLYTCNGKNLSPPLEWKNAPTNTRSFALILSCPDAGGEAFYNWVIYNIPSNVRELAEGANNGNLPAGTLVGDNGIGDAIYRGPCPPDDLKLHYIFTLYALDKKLNLFSEADIGEVFAAMRGHILKQAELRIEFNH